MCENNNGYVLLAMEIHPISMLFVVLDYQWHCLRMCTFRPQVVAREKRCANKPNKQEIQITNGK